MPGMADHHHLQAVFGMALGFVVHLGHQGAGGIDRNHPAGLGGGGHGFRHAMRGKDHRAVIGAVVQFLDKDRPFGAQVLDHIAVVDDLMPHIDRGAPFLDRHLDDLDRPVHPGAETARRGKVKRQRRQVGHGMASGEKRTVPLATVDCHKAQMPHLPKILPERPSSMVKPFAISSSCYGVGPFGEKVRPGELPGGVWCLSRIG